MELISTIGDEAAACRILAHLGMPTRAPRRGQPWHRQSQLGDRDRTDVDTVDPPSQFE